MKIFTVPGLFNSGPQHWQTAWEMKYGYTRIQQADWDTPVCAGWLMKIDECVMSNDPAEVILVGHSLGCCTIARWAGRFRRVIRGALLVAPSDVDAPTYPPGTTGFAPMPSQRLSFPSIVIASNNDEYVTMERAREFAYAWGSGFVDAGPLGHINSASALGDWPFVHQQLEQ